MQFFYSDLAFKLVFVISYSNATNDSKCNSDIYLKPMTNAEIKAPASSD